VERSTGSRSPASAATCVSEVDAPLPRMTALSVGAQLRQRRPRSSSERARKVLNPSAPSAPTALREKRSARNSSWVGSGVRCNRCAYIWLLQFLSKSLLVQRPRAVRIPRAHPRLPDAREPVHEHVDTSKAVARGSCLKAVAAARTEVGDADEWRDRDRGACPLITHDASVARERLAKRLGEVEKSRLRP